MVNCLMKKNPIYFAVISLLVIRCSAQGVTVSQAETELKLTTGGQWANYGNDPGGMRYSPLTTINVSNVKNLKVAWTHQTGELKTYDGTSIGSKAAFETTPLMIDGVLYFSTPTNRVFAIDASTGKEKWVYDPGVDLRGDYSEVTSRGVSKWINPAGKAGEDGFMRIFMATIDGRLIALDAMTGKPVSSFGNNGTIDLKENVGPIQVTSPPAIATSARPPST